MCIYLFFICRDSELINPNVGNVGFWHPLNLKSIEWVRAYARTAGARRYAIIWPAAESEGERAAAAAGRKRAVCETSGSLYVRSLYARTDYANVVISLRLSC